jgi:YceI-like domain
MHEPVHRKRRWFRRIAGAVAGVMVLGAGATIVYSHTITAPNPLTLPGAEPARDAGSPAIDGVWHVGAGSIVGWRVHQVLLGQQSTLVSRTGKVWGSVTIAAGSVTQGSVTADVAALTSNATQATVFGANTHPTATLVLAKPIPLGVVPAEGTVVRYPASGTLAFHGMTRVVPFTVAVERTGSGVAVLADLAIPFPDWGISVQGVPFLADLESPATVEVLLDLVRGRGNPASASTRP